MPAPAAALLARAHAAEFLSQATARDVSSPEHSRFFAPFHAAMARSSDGEVLGWSLEPSVRVYASHLDWRRYTVSFPGRSLTGRPHQVLSELLAPLGPPAILTGWLDRLRDQSHVPASVIFGASESDDEGVIYRAYLEQRSLDTVIGLCDGPRLAGLSVEWGTEGGPGKLRSYREVRLEPESLRAYGDLGDVFMQAKRELPVAFCYERDDVKGARAAQAILRPTCYPVARDAVLSLARGVGGDADALDHRLTALPDAEVRVLSIGTTRHGRRHATVYFSPPEPREAMLAGPTREATDRTPGALVLSLVRVDGMGSALITICAPIVDRRPPVLAGDLAVYQRGGDVALARALAALLGAEAAPALLRFARREAEARRLLAEHGYRLASVHQNEQP